MTGTFYLGAVFFVIYAGSIIATGKTDPHPTPQHTGPPAISEVLGVSEKTLSN
jgi:hypothetical protein